MAVIGGISIILLVLVALGTAYWYLLVIGAALRPSPPAGSPSDALTRFAVAIPAHNEEEVIAATIWQIQSAHYPAGNIDIYVVADHCEDGTLAQARAAGANVFERADGPRGSKGAALRWLFTRVFETGQKYDAVVIFDADSRVDQDFFIHIDRRLRQGASAVQGNHVIVNPQDGWFPALTWAMFLVDNRYQNQGRANLGFSAKNMGDAICFRTEILQKHGWGEGLTEDYAFRQMLLLEGIRITYEPQAKSYGQAPWNWQIAQKQRLRWLRGAQQASQSFRAELWGKGLQTGDLAMLEGALQGFWPSYSTLTLMAILPWLFHGILLLLTGALMLLFLLWTVMVVLLLIYPLIGLAMERAPLRAYLAILTGPVFIVWRTWLSLSARLGLQQATWVRTPHRGRQ